MGGPRTLDGFYALMGCTTPLDGASRGCGSSVTNVHINVEVWTSGYQNHWDQIQKDFPDMAPKNLGNMGPVDLFQSVLFFNSKSLRFQAVEYANSTLIETIN